MIEKNELLYLVQEEVEICKHLFSRIPKDAMSYKPADGQRSILELLQYLTICGLVGEGLVTDNWDYYQALQTTAAAMSASDFPKAMDNQMTQIKSYVDSISEDDWKGRMVQAPMGNTDPIHMAMVISPARFLTAYRMQLFLYIKGAGVSDLSTEDCWLKRST